MIPMRAIAAAGLASACLVALLPVEPAVAAGRTVSLGRPSAGRVTVVIGHWVARGSRPARPQLATRAPRGVLVLAAVSRKGSRAEAALVVVRRASGAAAARSPRLRASLGRGWRPALQRRATLDPAAAPGPTVCSSLPDGTLDPVHRAPVRRLDRAGDGPDLAGFAAATLLRQALGMACRAQAAPALAAYVRGEAAPRPCPQRSEASGFAAWMNAGPQGEYGIVFQSNQCGVRHGLLKADDKLTPFPLASPCSSGEDTDLPAGYDCWVDGAGYARFDARPGAAALQPDTNYRLVVRYPFGGGHLPTYDGQQADRLTLRLYAGSVDAAGFVQTIPVSVTP